VAKWMPLLLRELSYYYTELAIISRQLSGWAWSLYWFSYFM